MKETRQYIKCDRCGKEISVGQETSTLENGQVIKTWANLPEGWITTIDHNDLCPECAKKYREMQKSFFNK